MLSFTIMESQSKPSQKILKNSDRVKRKLIWAVLILVIIGVIGANIWPSISRQESPKTESADVSSGIAVQHPLPNFSLTDQHGAYVGLSDFRGKIWVADFIFTSCVTICPPMTGEMAALQEEFLTDDLHFVSFSVDPERDTPEVLFGYADRYGADKDRWSFLTGEKKTIYQLAHDGFNLAAGDQGSEILHSSRFVLIDREGQVRDYYDSRSKVALQNLRRDIKTLLQ